jgi:RHS repeat-associated protein
MRIYLAIAVLLPGGLCLAQSQSCPTPISSWSGNYTLNGTASQVACGGGTYTCNISQSVAATLKPWIQVVSCQGLNVGLIGKIKSAKLGDTATSTNDSCASQGNTGAKPFDNNILQIYPTTGTYSLAVEPYAAETETPAGCDGGNSEIGLAPETQAQTFTLPASIEPLKSGLSFSGQAWFFNAPSGWEFDFTLIPIYNPDDDCKKDSGQGDQGDGGQGDPVSSSIGCQSQSLGEDVPIVGTGFNLHYESSRHPGAYGNSVASADAFMIGGWTLTVHHAYDTNTNTLFLGDGTQRNGYQLGTPVSFNGDLLLTSEDGSEVYVFNGSTGLHMQTLRPLTGALEYQFGYDAAGKLVTVIDASGNVTTIQRNASEQPTAIVSPYGQTTTLGVDSDGFLNQVTDPLDKSETFVNTGTGLLNSRTDANGNTFTYTYDLNSGTLSKDADPLGGYIMLGRTDATSGFGWTVGETTSMGRKSSYKSTFTMPWVQSSSAASYSEEQTNIWPDGLHSTSITNLASGQLSKQVSLPDGTSDGQTLGPDPVWGIQAPVETSETLTQGTLTMNITGSRSTTLGTAGSPFTVTTETDTQITNGRSYTSTFTGSNRTWVDTSPVGRTLTIGLDSLERIASTQVEGLTATDFAYDSRDRLLSATQGTRTTTLGYNPDGFLSSITDPLTRKTSLGYDSDGRVLNTTLPDGRVINYTYDGNGNLTSVTPPGKSGHDFVYNAVNLPETYTPPTVPGTGSTTYGYNLDRDLTIITRPDGETITYGYDTAGRLISIGTPTGTTKFTYGSITGNLVSTVRGVESLAYGYNGPLPTKSTWTGTVAGTVNHTYNDNFWISSESVGGGTITFKYDTDGLLIDAGSLTVRRSPKNGLITGTTLGITTDSRAYNGLGELIDYTASVSGKPVYTQTLTRDADSRVEAKTETVSGTTNRYSYKYDLAGRLSTATKNSTTDTYTYDSNSNRLTATTPAGTSKGTYDAQDRLLTYGTASYTYTANGELASQTVGSQTTTYTYDVLGNLIAATLPNGTQITYIVDAENHRVGKEVNGVLETGFLYDGDQIVAQLSGSNQLVSQFVYGTGSASPDFMVSGGATYRIFSDQLGSPVLVINTSTGAIAEQIAYDEFGNVISDTNPGFQPFGFAGGLYDQDTKLVRFGARDNNPSIGRWTAKDPTLFDGGDTNLYSYVLNDPVNVTDPTGLTIYREDAVKWVGKSPSKPVQCQKCKQKQTKNPKSTKNKPPISRSSPVVVISDTGQTGTLTIQLPDGSTVISDQGGTVLIGPQQPVMPPKVPTGVCRP